MCVYYVFRITKLTKRLSTRVPAQLTVQSLAVQTALCGMHSQAINQSIEHATIGVPLYGIQIMYILTTYSVQRAPVHVVVNVEGAVLLLVVGHKLGQSARLLVENGQVTLQDLDVERRIQEASMLLPFIP